MGLAALWKLDESTGIVIADSAGSNTGTWSGTDLITNGDFEIAGAGGNDVFGTWNETAQGANVSVQDVDVDQAHGGTSGTTHACNLWTDNGDIVQVTQSVLTIGKTYTATVDIKVATVGGVVIQNQTQQSAELSTVAVHSYTFTAISDTVSIKRSGGATDITLKDVAVRENVDPSDRGLLFDGVGDYIDIGDTSINVKSVSLWIKQSVIAGNEFPIDLDGTSYLSIESGVITVYGFTAPVV